MSWRNVRKATLSGTKEPACQVESKKSTFPELQNLSRCFELHAELFEQVAHTHSLLHSAVQCHRLRIAGRICPDLLNRLSVNRRCVHHDNDACVRVVLHIWSLACEAAVDIHHWDLKKIHLSHPTALLTSSVRHASRKFPVSTVNLTDW